MQMREVFKTEMDTRALMSLTRAFPGIIYIFTKKAFCLYQRCMSNRFFFPQKFVKSKTAVEDKATSHIAQHLIQELYFTASDMQLRHLFLAVNVNHRMQNSVL